jgi:hypothetical protein
MLVHTEFSLRKVGRDRMAIMVDSPHHAYSHVKFTISEKGVENAAAKAAVNDNESV